MPKQFDACVKAGGKVRTMDLPNGRYMHVCIDHNGSHAGHVKTKMKKNGK